MSNGEDRVFIGNRSGWNGEEPFGLSHADRQHHLYVIGKTGCGKTTLLRNLILQDIEAGRGVGVIDPHGDLAEELLDFIPPWRTDHVLYFNPVDAEHPIGFNPLRSEEPPHLIASGIVGALKSIWRDSWGPRLEYILYAAVAALAECKNTSFLGLPRMLTDERYRAWVVKQVKDPVVRAFWLREFEGYDRRFMQEAIAPIQNKVGQLLMAAPLRNILGQVRNRIDARFLMDGGRIFIANLSKGRLGEDRANLLGALLVTQFQHAAKSRAELPEAARRDFHLSVDEFHSFSTDAFASVLSEARKYRLCLTLAHQYVGQLREEVMKAVFGNAGSVVAFRVGNADADVLEREFGEEYSARSFVELGNHEVCAKILDGGRCRQPFFGKTLPPLGTRHGRRQIIIRRSRERYARPRNVVEGKIRRWMKG